MQPAGAITVYVSIGNSDDKLSQARWSEFHGKVNEAVRDRALTVFGDWVSPSSDPWQNACIAFGIDYDDVPFLKSELRELAAKFGQDAVVWAEVRLTEFVGPSEVLPA
jgi:hypothetical protein